MANKRMVLIGGISGTGKSLSLYGLKDDEGVIYLNCDAGKDLPFKAKFKQLVVTDPLQVLDALEKVEGMPEVHTVVIDTLTFLMNMYEMQYVNTAADTRKAWLEYGNFFQSLMLEYAAKSTKTLIFLAHVFPQYDEANEIVQISVPIAGRSKNQGVESMFSTVLSVKKVPVKELEKYANPMLNITDEERELGFKHVFQTRLTAKTAQERLRSPMGMWSSKETYIDNNIKHVLDKLNEYYA